MSNHEVKVLFLGDVCGQPGNRALFMGLQELQKTHKPDFCVVNIENNGPRGVGVDQDSLSRLFALGIDAMTTGNHVWDIPGNHEFLNDLSTQPVLRPINYHKTLPGKGSTIITSKNTSSGKPLRLGIINALGVHSMRPLTPPFELVRNTAKELQKETPLILVDFHAESTEEKEAMAWYLDGEVSAVLGTHTHVQTMDNRILPKGCGYITDVGMTGSLSGVIGFEAESAVQRQISQLPLQISVDHGSSSIQGVCVTLNETTGETLHIERINHFVGV